MAVFIELENHSVSRVRWQPTLINQKSQPRLLKASEPEFGEVLACMRKITAAQKIDTQYEVDGDTVVCTTPGAAAEANAAKTRAAVSA